MTIQITWGAVSAICAVLTGLATGLAFVIRAIVRQEVSKLDERYVLTRVFEAYTDRARMRIQKLEGGPYAA